MTDFLKVAYRTEKDLVEAIRLLMNRKDETTDPDEMDEIDVEIAELEAELARVRQTPRPI